MTLLSQWLTDAACRHAFERSPVVRVDIPPPPLRSNPEAADAPVVDVNFNDRGFNALAFRGSVLHQNQPASGGPAPEINWWLVGGIAVGAAVVIHEENKKDPVPPAAAKKGGGGSF